MVDDVAAGQALAATLAELIPLDRSATPSALARRLGVRWSTVVAGARLAGWAWPYRAADGAGGPWVPRAECRRDYKRLRWRGLLCASAKDWNGLGLAKSEWDRAADGGSTQEVPDASAG